MRKSIPLFAVILVLMVPALQTSANEMNVEMGPDDMCQVKDLGVKFLCQKDWAIRPVDDAVLVIISAEPDVTLIVARIDSRIKFLSQLTNSFLETKERYARGFRTERVKFADREAIKVKAFAKDKPQKRLLDYYFINDSSLYGVLFSVKPKEDTDDYKFLFQDIIDRFEFI